MKKLFNLWEKKLSFKLFFIKGFCSLQFFSLKSFYRKNIVPTREKRPAVGNRPYAGLLPGDRKLDVPAIIYPFDVFLKFMDQNTLRSLFPLSLSP